MYLRNNDACTWVAHTYNSALIVKVLCETQITKLALEVHILFGADNYIPAVIIVCVQWEAHLQPSPCTLRSSHL